MQKTTVDEQMDRLREMFERDNLILTTEMSTALNISSNTFNLLEADFAILTIIIIIIIIIKQENNEWRIIKD